ncbi:hypothetical protein D3C78_1567740 [compost metagenome]
MGSGLQADDGREDDVASPDEQGEGHKAKRQDILAFQGFHWGITTSLKQGLPKGFPDWVGGNVIHPFGIDRWCPAPALVRRAERDSCKPTDFTWGIA